MNFSMHYEIQCDDEVFANVRIYDVDPEGPGQDLIERVEDEDGANGVVVIHADARGVFHLASLWRDGVQVYLDGMMRDEAQRIANSVVADLRRDEPQLFVR